MGYHLQSFPLSKGLNTGRLLKLFHFNKVKYCALKH